MGEIKAEVKSRYKKLDPAQIHEMAELVKLRKPALWACLPQLDNAVSGFLQGEEPDFGFLKNQRFEADVLE